MTEKEMTPRELAKSMTAKNEIPFGRNLSRLMRQKGLRIHDVAEIARVSKSVVHAWTTGTSPRDLVAVRRLAQALGIQFSELVFGEPEILASEMPQLEDVPFFDGYCRLRIDRIVMKK